MVIRFFKKSYLSQLMALILLALVWWLPAFFVQPTSVSPTTGFLSSPEFWLIPAGLLLFLSTAFIINKTGTDTRLVDRNSYLIAFFFVLTGSASGFMTRLTPFLAAAFFFALFYQKVYGFQKSSNIILTAFDSGLFLGLTSLFYPPALLLVIFVWFALVVYQSDQWRAYITAILGVALPWFFVFSGGYLSGRLPWVFAWFQKYFHLRIMTNPFHSVPDLAMFAFITLVTLLASLWLMGSLQGLKINLRQHGLATLWGIVFTFLPLVLFNAPLPSLILTVVPSSLVLGTFFSRIKKLRWAERLVLLWILFVFVNQYLPLFYAS